LTFSAEYLADRTKIGQVKAEHVAAVGRISMLPRDTTLVLASTRLRFSSAGSSNGRLKVSEKEFIRKHGTREGSKAVTATRIRRGEPLKVLA
jgi:hypothetical protein